MKLLRLQAEGKLGGPVPRAVLQRQFQQLQKRPRLHVNVRPDVGAVRIWSTMTPKNYLFGTGKGGKKVKVAYDTESSFGCGAPVGIKVDHSQNLWIGCETNSFTPYGTNMVVETGPYGSEFYPVVCPLSGGPFHCEQVQATGFDAAVNSTYVFAPMYGFFFDECVYSSCSNYSGTGFEYWPNGNPSATPGLIELGPPVQNVYYADIDSSNNVYFDYYGCLSSTCGFGLAELVNGGSYFLPVFLEPPGTYEFGGGVYLSNGGSILNVIDQLTRLVYQYKLPITGGQSPFNISGPTGAGAGDPVTGGFDSTSNRMAIGDASGWLDLGNIGTDHWAAKKAPQFTDALEGAAFTPSDK